MALKLILKDDEGKLLEVSWTVGHPSPFVGVHRHSVYRVGEVYADGAELDYISTVFELLPKMIVRTRHSTVRYFGDHAKFIAGNLPI